VHGARTWKLEYPIGRVESILPPIILAIWCAVEGNSSPAGAERVAQILAPAVAEWFALHWKHEEVQHMLAERFPGVYTPVHAFPAITGDFSLREPKTSPRRRSSGEGQQRQLNGD
jgi:hypothetical protein